VRLEEAEELFVVGDGLAVQDATPRLVHDALPERMEVGQLFHQRLGLGVGPGAVALRRDAVPEPMGHASRPAQDPLHTPKEPLIRALERSGPSTLLRGRARDGQGLALGATRMQPTRSHHVRVHLAGSLDQSSQHPVAVPEQGRVGGPVDVRLHGRGVQTQPIARDLLLAHGMAGEGAMDLLPGHRTQSVLELVERREVHHGLHPEADELAQGGTVIDPDNRLAQRQPFQGLHDEQAEHVLRGESDTRGSRPVRGEQGVPEIAVGKVYDLGGRIEDLGDGLVLGVVFPRQLQVRRGERELALSFELGAQADHLVEELGFLHRRVSPAKPLPQGAASPQDLRKRPRITRFGAVFNRAQHRATGTS
jgi:hypothetical protein